MNILEKIRDEQKKARIAGKAPRYVRITSTEYEELIDILLEQEIISTFESDTPCILGMKIITNEDEILRL